MNGISKLHLITKGIMLSQNKIDSMFNLIAILMRCFFQEYVAEVLNMNLNDFSHLLAHILRKGTKAQRNPE